MDPADEVQPAQFVARMLEEAKARLAVPLARAYATCEDQAAPLAAPRRASLSVPDEPGESYPLITGQDEPLPHSPAHRRIGLGVLARARVLNILPILGILGLKFRDTILIAGNP